MILVRMNHLEFTTESNKTKLSIIRFWEEISIKLNRTGIAGLYLVALLQEDLIVLAQCHAEND
jgi:hypothetical protein